MSGISLDAIARYQVDHLVDGLAYWGQSQTNWTLHSEKTRFDIQGLDWDGHAREAALARAVQDERTAGDAAAVAQAAQQTARLESDALMALRSKVLSNVAAAREDGFTVDDDSSVQDTMTEYDDEQTARNRQSAAEQHCADIYSSAKAFHEYDEQVAETFKQHRADLQKVNAHIRAV
jgi:hypothetical protein